MTLTTFSKKIKKDTSKSHSMAENTGFVTNFLAGVVSKDSYKQLIADFYFIYTALEEQVEKFKDDPFIAPMRLMNSNVCLLSKRIVSFIGEKTWKILFLLQMPVKITSRELKRSMLSS